MQKHAAPIIQEMLCQTEKSYQQSPYYTLNKRKLRALSNDMKSLQTSTPIQNNYGILDNGRKDVILMPVDLEEPLPQIYEKKHKFKIHNFKGLNWCELCANYLWGFKAQGVKCLGECCQVFTIWKFKIVFRFSADCGFVAHNKCSELVPAKCVPDLKSIRGIFGTDITTLVTVHKCTIPFIVKKCIEEVESRGMLQEGIYRVSGFADEIDALKMSLDKGISTLKRRQIRFFSIKYFALHRWRKSGHVRIGILKHKRHIGNYETISPFITFAVDNSSSLSSIYSFHK
jgi:chimaerin